MAAVPVNNQRKFIQSLKLPFQFLLVIWGVHLVQVLFNLDFARFGILPRDLQGLWGVLLAPLIHADFTHLTSNSVPFFVLSAIIVFFYRRVAIPAFVMIYLLTGVAVWLLARGVYHIGASGVVYGLVAFIFWMGVFRRSVKAIILALIVTVLYSGMFLGVLPNQDGISWESHLYGALVGIFTAYWFKDDLETDDQPKRYAYELEEEQEQNFFDSNIFDQTKQDRWRSGW